MSIRNITTDELRRMSHQEGLVIQGCGGDPQEWLDGINGILTENQILLDGTKFEDAYLFKHDGVTNLLFPMDGKANLNVGRLAMWRIGTHETFGGTWLSDYVDNRLGGFVKEHQGKPDCPLIGQDGNIFNLMGIASRTLREAGLADQAKEMCQRIHASGSYGEALNIIGDYRELRGQALYDYLQSEEGRRKHFDRMVDDEGNEIGVELHNEEIRRQYDKDRQHRRYLERMIEEDGLTFLPYGENGTDTSEESVVDESADIEAMLFEAVLIKEVRVVFERLTEEEQMLLEALIMSENRITTTAYGQIKGIPQQTVCYRKNALLKKLKKLLDEVW